LYTFGNIWKNSSHYIIIMTRKLENVLTFKNDKLISHVNQMYRFLNLRINGI